MKLQVINHDWKVKNLKIDNRVFIKRYGDKKIPTFLAMRRSFMKLSK
jgi:hypothetical protein